MAAPTVFVVDGDHDVRESTCELLRANGYTISPFSTTAAFESTFSPGQAGCVVLDISLPDQSGLVLQQRLKERQIGLPVIAVSGRATTRLVVDAIKQGATEFLEKLGYTGCYSTSSPQPEAAGIPARPALWKH